jgi:hypothetical protein
MHELSGAFRLSACVAVAALSVGCGTSSSVAQQSPTPSSATSPSPTPLTCTAGGPASSTWPAPDKRTATTPPIVSAVASGDTLTLTFDQGTPLFEVTPQATAHFTETNGRGGPVDLAGSAGVLIILRGFRGDMANYAGTKDFKPNGALLLEVQEIGDYEGVIGWAAGLSAPGCANVTVGGSTLAFQFIRSPG